MKSIDSEEFKHIVLISLISFFLTFAIISISRTINENRDIRKEITGFSSDFSDISNVSDDLYKANLSRSKNFIAFSRYTTLLPGKYRVSFYVESNINEDADCVFEIASSKGREIETELHKEVSRFPSITELNLELRENREIEPRIRLISGNSRVVLSKVSIVKTGSVIPWSYIFIKSLYIFPILLLIILTVCLIFKEDNRWRNALAFLLFYIGFFMIVKYAWISEDSFITLRHVDNFISGHGPVFNLGERVEGYTHALWFYIISVFRAVGLSPKASTMIPSLIFSGLFLFILFFKFAKDEQSGLPLINFPGAILIGMSCFIDFGTSGLETSLSYLLLITFAIQITRESYIKKPILFGITSTLLILNRPDFGIFFIFSIILISYKTISQRTDPKNILKFLSVPVIVLSLYEIFRMGYYGSVFPNPFYAKSGSSPYYSQGIKYFFDLLKGSAFSLIILLSILLFFAGRSTLKKDVGSRYIVFLSAIFYGFFVIRGGGDFMHGRFLLPSVILLVLSSAGIFDNIFTRRSTGKIVALALVIILFSFSRSIIPLQKKVSKGFVNGISDERFSFYHGRVVPLKDIFNDEIIFMWKTIGKNYDFLSKKAKIRLRIAYHTVGYIGYYSGRRTYVVDRLGLTDPVVARIKIEKRGRPGHEKSAPFGYLIYKKLTFGETPFPVWNRLAMTEYGILWDLSRKTLDRFKFFLDTEFKSHLDSGILGFLKTLSPESAEKQSDFLFFLKNFWEPFSPEEGRHLFRQIYTKRIEDNSESFKWIKKNKGMIEKWKKVISGKITPANFIDNIGFAIKDLFR